MILVALLLSLLLASARPTWNERRQLDWVCRKSAPAVLHYIYIYIYIYITAMNISTLVRTIIKGIIMIMIAIAILTVPSLGFRVYGLAHIRRHSCLA